MTGIVNSLLAVEADQVNRERGFGGWAVVTLFTVVQYSKVRTRNLVSKSANYQPFPQ